MRLEMKVKKISNIYKHFCHHCGTKIQGKQFKVMDSYIDKGTNSIMYTGNIYCQACLDIIVSVGGKDVPKNDQLELL